MPVIGWSKDFLVGIKDIDENHRYLMRLLNETYDGYVLGIVTDLFNLDELFQCLTDCFVYEEILMIGTSYCSYLAHKASHELFKINFLEMYNNNNTNEFIDILMFFNNWVYRHIRDADSKFGDFLRAESLGLVQKPRYSSSAAREYLGA